ncbi:hypothetical protein D3C73_1458590 [compost metagenome]
MFTPGATLASPWSKVLASALASAMVLAGSAEAAAGSSLIASKARAVNSPDCCRALKALAFSGPDRASKKLVMPC